MDLFSYLMGKKSSGGGGGGTTGLDWSLIGYDETLGNTQNQTLESDFNYSKSIYDNWDSSITSMALKYYQDRRLVYFPSVDTSNVTSFQNAFNNATALTTVGSIDVSNATSLSSMFGYDYRLQFLGNTEFNVPLVTDTSSMFNNCMSLETAPKFVFNKASVSMDSMFSGCTNLKNVPIFEGRRYMDGSGSNMFANCPNLTNNSLNNIMAFFYNLSLSSTKKTLKYWGLSSTQADICVTLSNWELLSAKSWTTGY